MICQQCAVKGAKSIVHQMGGSSTLLHNYPFYDEEGEYHFHDRNKETASYRCSNGHTWKEQVQGKPCPNPNCIWGRDLEKMGAENLRGLTYDLVIIDEIQDVLPGED